MILNNLFEVIQQVGQKPFEDFVQTATQNSISQNSNDFSNLSSSGFVFKQFKSFEDSFEEIIKIRNKSNKKNYEEKALFAVNDRKFNDYKAFTDYINTSDLKLEKIKEISNVILENIKTLINLGGLFSNDRIIITEDNRGVFDFGLASLGLYRPIEFFSKNLQDDIQSRIINNPNGLADLELGIVNGDNVKKKIIGNQTSFHFNYLGKNYECERRQRGATKVFNNFYNDCFLKSNNDGINITYFLNNTNKVFNGIGKIKLKYASNNKKSFLIFNKKEDSVKNVDIFLPVNFLTSSDSTRVIALLPVYLISASLEEFGIQTRISALRIGSDSKTQITISVPVKDYEESTKISFNRIFNVLAKSSSAETFFGFHKIITENEGIQANATKILSSSFETVAYDEKNYIDTMMQRYKNWAEFNKDASFINTKVKNPNFQFAVNQRAEYLNDLDYPLILNELHFVFYQYYYYMDFLAIEMIQMREFIKNLYKRFTEDITFRKIYSLPSVKTEILDLIRAYVITMIVEKYKIVSGGKYFDNKEQVKKKETTFKEKIISLNEELNSI